MQPTSSHTGNSAMGAAASIVVLLVWLLSPMPDTGGAVFRHLVDGIAIPSTVVVALGVLVGSVLNLIFHRHNTTNRAASARPSLTAAPKGL